MSFSARVYTNIPQLLNQWKRKTREFENKNELTVREVAEYGATFAKQIAPHDTTSLIQAISWKTVGSKKAPRAMVWVRPSPINPKRSAGGGDLQHSRPSWYANLMHFNSDIAKNIKTGDPRFMITMKRRVKQKLGRDIIANVGRFVK